MSNQGAIDMLRAVIRVLEVAPAVAEPVEGAEPAVTGLQIDLSEEEGKAIADLDAQQIAGHEDDAGMD